MDHSKHTQLAANEFTEAVLEGATITGRKTRRLRLLPTSMEP